MKVDLSFLSKDVQKKIKVIARFANEKKIRAYLVGGIVRDLLLKKQSKDIDIVFEGEAIPVACLCAVKFKAKMVLHHRFGTAVVTCRDGSVIDFVTARKEIYRRPGMLPQVQFSTLKDDLYRRDFTINSMAISIDKNGFGGVIDYFNGYEDLCAKKVRVHHSQSFVDDATRILRAVRFEQRFSFKIERTSLLWLKDALRNGQEKTIKAPRYFAEFRKFFNEPDSILCLRRLQDVGGFGFLDLKEEHVFRRLRQVEEGLRVCKMVMDPVSFYLMAFYENQTPRSIEGIAKKNSFQKAEKKSVIAVAGGVKSLKILVKKELLPSQVYQNLKLFNLDVVYYLLFRSKALSVRQRINRFLMIDRFVILNISGADCKKCGVLSGEKIGRLLQGVLNQKINQGFKTKQEELSVLRSLIRKKDN